MTGHEMSAKILLVEDNRHQRTLYKQNLENEGYKVFDAKNGAEALNFAVKHQPDLAVLDIKLVGEDGLELMGKLLSIDENLRIILHTAYGAWKDNFRGKMADAYVIKSSDLTQLKDTIKNLLSSKTE